MKQRSVATQPIKEIKPYGFALNGFIQKIKLISKLSWREKEKKREIGLKAIKKREKLV
jgi:hypothetical protein